MSEPAPPRPLPKLPKQWHALLEKLFGDLDVGVSRCVAGADIQEFEDRFVVLQNDSVIEIQLLWIKKKRLNVHLPAIEQ